ncbi:hypothetical protein QTP70_014296, partial [Hemibagrus guttatus]
RRMDPATPPQNTSPTTDPAELREIIVWQGAVIRSYQDQVEALQSQLRSTSTAALRDPPAARGESPRLAMPEKFDGSADLCRGFLRQCKVFFSHQPGIYRKEGTRCAFLLSLLTNRALEWASAVWDADPQIRSSFSYFAGLIREVFEYPTGGQGHFRSADGVTPGLRLRSRLRHQVPHPRGSVGVERRSTVGGVPRRTEPRFPDGAGMLRRGHLADAVRWLQPESSVPGEVFVRTALIVNLIDEALVEELRIPTFPCVPSLKIMAINSQPIGGAILRARPNCWNSRTSCIKETIPSAHCHIPHAYADFQEGAGLPPFATTGQGYGGLHRGSSSRGSHSALHVPSSGGVLLRRQEGWRLSAVYRLNAITVRYPYPLHLVPAALEQLSGARFFTKLDLRSAYNLVRIRKGDEWKTAFHTTHGHYEYRVMPFGLTNAPAVFQALINGVFQDLLGKWVIAYINDILVYSTSMEEHVCHVREVLSRLQQHHLYVKLEKCKFHRTTVTFMGYVISRQGVEMDAVKVQAVTEWPSPLQCGNCSVSWALQTSTGVSYATTAP